MRRCAKSCALRSGYGYDALCGGHEFCMPVDPLPPLQQKLMVRADVGNYGGAGSASNNPTHISISSLRGVAGAPFLGYVRWNRRRYHNRVGSIAEAN